MVNHVGPTGRASAPTSDVVVIGSGPVGRWLAMTLASGGLDVRVVTRQSRAALTNIYGVWLDHLAEVDLPMAYRWAGVDVVAEQRHHVARPYGLVDRGALVSMTDRALGDAWIEGEVVGIGTARHGRDVVVSSGQVLATRLVIDASGTARVSAPRPSSPARHAHQIALGDVVRTDQRPAVPMLMDFSGGDGADKAPTFGYVLPVGDGRLLIEETWLAVRPTRSPNELRGALDARRQATVGGAVTNEVLDRELVSIDLEVPVVGRGANTVMLGAAGGQIHPATGYSLAAGVVTAQRIGQWCVTHRDTLGHDDAVGALNQLVMSPSQRRARTLFAFGLDGLLRMDRRTMAAFFEAFFRLDPIDQSAYLNGLSDVADVRRTMTKFFPTLPRRVQRALVAGSPLRLARAFV
jgi:lycopene beta-cyclase